MDIDLKNRKDIEGVNDTAGFDETGENMTANH
jgi:hypothetical protein